MSGGFKRIALDNDTQRFDIQSFETDGATACFFLLTRPRIARTSEASFNAEARRNDFFDYL